MICQVIISICQVICQVIISICQVKCQADFFQLLVNSFYLFIILEDEVGLLGEEGDGGGGFEEFELGWERIDLSELIDKGLLGFQKGLVLR